ncbi:MAG: inovirus Gp2 family protein, partial [Synergistaceae bacterium]|nr:inovirus Gp2 family protein [Synergistaceae bacterium]
MNKKADDYKDKYQYKQKILKATEDIINDYTTRHSKTMATRFDFHYPVDYQHDTSTNKNISFCMAKLVKKYKRYGLDPSFIWTREQRYSENPHYHCMMLLNGSKTKNPYHIFKNAEKLWSLTIDSDASGLV